MAHALSLLPTASVAITAASASLGAGDDVFQAIQAKDDDTSYIYAGPKDGTKSNHYSLEGNMITYSAPISQVVVNLWLAAAAGTTFFMQADAGLRIGGTVYLSGSPQSVSSTTYTLFQFTFTDNPATASAWTKYDIDALEISLSLEGGTGTASLKCTHAYAEVHYEPVTDALMFGS